MRRELNWSDVIDRIPTQCSRGHETVEMINYNRETVSEYGVAVCLFCPSCHQKLKVKAKRIDSGRWAATGYEILHNGDLQT